MLEILLIILLFAICIFTYKKVGEWTINKVKSKEVIFSIGFTIAMLLSIFIDSIIDLVLK